MMVNKNYYKKLNNILKKTTREEISCSKLLDEAGKINPQYLNILFPYCSMIKVKYLKCEQRGTTGNFDLFVCGEVSEVTKEKRIYIWEIKAHTCNLFNEDPNNKERLNPSQDLLNAENQLFYYHDEFSSDGFLKKKYQKYIDDLDNVRLGGIIIGRRSNPLNEKLPEEWTTAVRIRNKYIYEKNKMKLYTWDNILDHFKEVQLKDTTKKEGKSVVKLKETKTTDYAVVGSAIVGKSKVL